MRGGSYRDRDGDGDGGPPGSGTQRRRGRSSEEQKSEKNSAGSRFGISDQAAGVFENVWGKVVG